MSRTSREALKTRIPEIHFAPEGLVSSDQKEYLDQFIGMLKSHGFNPNDLIFSGFNARPLADKKPLPRYDGIFAMNIAGWRESTNNPAHYAERWYENGGVPCIGLYDRSQLVEIYSHDPLDHPGNLIASEKEFGKIMLGGTPIRVPEVEEGYDPRYVRLETYEDYLEDRTKFKNVVLGEPLASLPLEIPVEEGVAHIDYPDGSPTDALVGLVFLDHV